MAAGLVLLALAVAAVFAFTFDPNRYRDDLERLVRERTGRSLQLKGPVELAFWPSLGAKVSQVTLSERAAEREFLSLASAHASVALLPLLRGQVIVDRVRIEGLNARVVKDKDGRFNFADLLEGGAAAPGGGKPPPAPESEGASDRSPVAFDIAGVEVVRSAISYRDAASGEALALSEFNLQTGRIAENAQGKVALSTVLSRKAPPLEARFSLDGAYALRREALDVEFTSRLDDSTLQGKVGIARAPQAAHTFALRIDAIDLDRYLASSAGEKPSEKAAAAGTKPGPAAKPQDDAPVDLSGLKGLNAKGSLHIGALQVQGLKLAELKTEVRAAGGKAELGPHAARLYEGTVAGTVRLDGNANRIALQETLSGVAIGPLLRDLAEQDRLEGRGDLAVDLTAAGATVNAMKRALNGSAKVQLRDGAIKGIDIAGLLRKARAALGRDSGGSGSADANEKTDFSELNGTFQVKNGVAHNDDLEVKAPLFRIGGAGSIDLAAETISYVLKPTVVASAQGQGGKDLDELAGVTVPVRLSGPLADMKYEVDLRAAASELAKSKVGGRVKESIEKRKEEIGDKLEDRVRDRLKGLLGR